METKKWWESKTIWSGIVGIIIAAWNAGVNSVFALPPIPEFVFAILGFVGIYGRTTANTVVK